MHLRGTSTPYESWSGGRWPAGRQSIPRIALPFGQGVEHRFGEYLKQMTFVIPVYQDAQFLEGFDGDFKALFRDR
jgi:hypothetical protein